MKMAFHPAHLGESGSPTAAVSTAQRFDQAKVSHMAQAIAAGTFAVDAEAIADRLLANARRLAVQAGHRRTHGLGQL